MLLLDGAVLQVLARERDDVRSVEPATARTAEGLHGTRNIAFRVQPLTRAIHMADFCRGQLLTQYVLSYP